MSSRSSGVTNVRQSASVICWVMRLSLWRLSANSLRSPWSGWLEFFDEGLEQTVLARASAALASRRS